MNFEEFTEKILEEISKKMKNEGNAEIQRIRKNNDVVLFGLTIYSAKSNVVPTIYLESFYELYQKQVPIELIADKIWSVYEENLPKENIDLEFLKDFEQVKDRIVYRLVHAERNRGLLKEVPHILFWDLAICFCYAFWSEELGEGMILIHNAQMDSWGVNSQILMHLAEENTPKLFPMCFCSMREMLQQMEFEFDLSEWEDEQLYVLSNNTRTYGASVVLYPETLTYIADRLQCDFYILPSSVHEMLVLKKEKYDTLQNEGKVMHEMIKCINQEQLSPEEVLSDYPFYYDRLEGKLRQII